uniref:Uncharacterized protein n=1 Tax=Cucumis melo TaxID=3656 RepID=A0A9I9E5L4_CUCME
MNVSKKSFCNDLSIQAFINAFFKQGFIKICRVQKCHCPTFTQPSITLTVLMIYLNLISTSFNDNRTLNIALHIPSNRRSNTTFEGEQMFSNKQQPTK